MKTYQLRPVCPTHPAILDRLPSLQRRLAAEEAGGGERAFVCLGGDLEKAGVCLAMQIGAGGVCAHGMFSRQEAAALVSELLARGWPVAVGVEACGFGWRFQTQLREAGATVFSFATEPLTGRRKNNRRDAAALARLVAGRVIHGDLKCGRVVREPSVDEQRRRYLTRHRAQLVALRGRIEGQGRGLLYDLGHEAVPDCWWGRKTWPRLMARLAATGDQWLCQALEKQREIALAVHAQILALDAEIDTFAQQQATRAETPSVPRGLGALTSTTLGFEIMDWHRFKNRKQAGSYIGCSPSEHSTGTGQLLGNIDRQGNRRLRTALTEAVWRLLQWNPGWRGFAKFGEVLREKTGSNVRKKKAVMACVRLLFIDLWRLHTGRTTLEAVGLQPALEKDAAILSHCAA